MAQKTRIGLMAAPMGLYGSFAGKGVGKLSAARRQQHMKVISRCGRLKLRRRCK